MSRLALIDGDVIRYQVGYATQRKVYTVFDKTFLTLIEAGEYTYDEGIPSENIKTSIVTDIREAVFHTVEKFIANVLVRAKADKAKVFLTGENNYREEIATIRPYKGHRSGDKPLNYDLITKYLLHKYDTEVIDGFEADDAMAWYQMKTGHGPSTCICTIDKDLNTIPGWHYDWKKDKLYNVSLPEADRFFYTQLITGDSVDNIEGCPGAGEKAAKSALSGRETTRQMYDAVLAEYVKAHTKFVKKHKLSCSDEQILEGATRDLHENAHLLWIQREEGVRWKSPSTE